MTIMEHLKEHVREQAAELDALRAQLAEAERKLAEQGERFEISDTAWAMKLAAANERVKALEEALEECQRLFQNIRDYGAMCSPTDWNKVQYTWSRVNAALAALDAKEQGNENT